MLTEPQLRELLSAFDYVHVHRSGLAGIITSAGLAKRPGRHSICEIAYSEVGVRSRTPHPTYKASNGLPKILRGRGPNTWEMLVRSCCGKTGRYRGTRLGAVDHIQRGAPDFCDRAANGVTNAGFKIRLCVETAMIIG